MGKNDGTVIGATTVINNGDPAERFNLVLVAEGYRQSELSQFADDAAFFVHGLFGMAPYDELQCAINIYRVDVASTDSGADDPVQCGGTGATPKTYFDATFCSGGVRRALTVDSVLALDVVTTQVPQFHPVQVIVNSPIYGGTGGSVGVSSTSKKKDDGTPVDWREILYHEMGHSIYGLADEYEYYQGCDVNEPGQNVWPGGEPSQTNITASPTAQGKWADLINTSTLPTTSNANCAQCDPQPDPGGPFLVGTFEGAGYYHCGLYRPKWVCKMRKLNFPFCDVCARVIREFLAAYDPTYCATRDRIDASRWMAVATILFGVIQDGGGVILVGGKPIPVDPWQSVRQSLWGILSNPYEAPPAMRDALVGTALGQIASLLSSSAARAQLQSAANKIAADAAAKLPSGTVR